MSEAERKARLAQALRQNLRRRKEQARAEAVVEPFVEERSAGQGDC